MAHLRIAIVSHFYRPENAAIPNSVAAGLAERGHEVRVLTTFPSYPHGRLFPGFRQRWRHEERDGDVTVKRVPTVISHSMNPIGRIAHYLSFVLSSTAAGRWLRDVDVIYVYATPMTAAAAPLLWKKLIGTPFVIHVQDLWPESVTGSAMVPDGVVKGAVDRLLAPWLRSIYRSADAVIAIAPTMRRWLEERGAPSASLHTLLNWTDETHAAAPTIRRPELLDTVRFTYAGNLGDHQGLETLLRAADLVRGRGDIQIRIVGSGVAEAGLRDLARELDLPNVEFTGQVPAAEMDRIHGASDFEVVSLAEGPIVGGTIPSKLQASLHAGVPVVTAVSGDVYSLVTEYRLGVACPSSSSHLLAEALCRAADMSPTERAETAERCRSFSLLHLAADKQIDRLEAILRSAARHPQKIS